MSEEKEKFLKRWSRLKEQAREAPAEKSPAPAIDPKAPPPELPPIEKLTLESDYRGFFHPKVDENLRRSALKKLFSDPHFNVMDGLDVYIDDYSKPDPLPAAMLAQLRQAQKILEWAREPPERDGGDGPKEAALPEEGAPQIEELAHAPEDLPSSPAQQDAAASRPAELPRPDTGKA